MTDPTQTAEALRPYSSIEGKPVLASWMGGANVQAGERILNRANIPTFAYPDTAVRLFNYMWKYTYNLRALYETPMHPADSEEETPDRDAVQHIIDQAKAEDRTILTEQESKAVLAAYGIPTTPMAFAETAEAAAAEADKMGYPVVVKLHSETITHKMDVGGVQLNLENADEVKAAFNRIQTSVSELKAASDFLGVTVQPMVKLDGYELIIGSSIDVQFGPVILFGTGGSLVEVFKDSALGLPPLTTTFARRMMEQTRIYEALHGVRGKEAVDLEELEKLLVRFSQLVAEQPWIKEIDINPLLASPERLLALDGRVVLHDADTPEADLPQLAIRPYPVQYMDMWTSEDGNDFIVRPIRPEDEPLMVKFHESLSERTVQLRYFTPMSLRQRTTHERLSRIVFVDYDREMVLVMARRNPKTEETEIAAVGRLTKSHSVAEAEFAIVVTDKYQGQGMGTEMLRRLIQVGKDEHVGRIKGYIRSYNSGMLKLAESQGFTLTETDENVIEAALTL